MEGVKEAKNGGECLFLSISYSQFSIIFRTFAAVKSDFRRYFASWLLLATFVPMLLFSSLHVHEDSSLMAEAESVGCVHLHCHGHLTTTVSWVNDCLFCQFLTLTMLTAAVFGVIVYVHVCRKFLAQPLCGYRVACCGINITRGPPSV